MLNLLPIKQDDRQAKAAAAEGRSLTKIVVMPKRTKESLFSSNLGRLKNPVPEEVRTAALLAFTMTMQEYLSPVIRDKRPNVCERWTISCPRYHLSPIESYG